MPTRHPPLHLQPRHLLWNRRGRCHSRWRERRKLATCVHYREIKEASFFFFSAYRSNCHARRSVSSTHLFFSFCDHWLHPRQSTCPNRHPTKPKGQTDKNGLIYKHLGFGRFGIFGPKIDRNRPVFTPSGEPQDCIIERCEGGQVDLKLLIMKQYIIII